MKEEDKAWLREVMDTMVRDDAQEMKLILKTVGDLFLVASKDDRADSKDPTQCEVEEGLESDKDERGQELLEELEDIVCQIDAAVNFVKLKGLECLSELLRSSQIPPLTRGAAAGVMATLSQNNPPVQEAMLQAGYMVLFSDLLQEEGLEESVKLRAFGALSSLVRSHAEAESAFSATEGPELLKILLRGASVRFKRKVLFFTKALLGAGAEPAPPARVEAFWEVVGALAGLLVTEDDLELRENALQLLVNLGQQGLKERLYAAYGAALDEARGVFAANPPPEPENAQRQEQLWKALDDLS